MELKWSTYKDTRTGYTIIQVKSGSREFKASITPYKASRITPSQFNRIIKMLKENMEL